MLATLLLFASSCVCSVEGESVDPGEAVRLVLAGHETRWSQVSSFQADVTRTTWNSPQAQRRVAAAARALGEAEQPAAQDDGAQLSIVETPAKYKVSQTVIGKGDRLRFNGSLVTPAKEERDDVFLLSDGELTIYDPTFAHVTICSADQATGAIRNLRSLAFQDERENLPALLDAGKVASAELIEFGRKQMLRLKVVHQDVVRVLLFDPARDYVLVRVWNLNAGEETVGYASLIRYENLSLDDGKVWMPTSSEQYVYWEKGVTVGEDLPDNWVQRIRYDVEDLQLNLDIPDEVFNPEFPAGTRISNTITGEGRIIP